MDPPAKKRPKIYHYCGNYPYDNLSYTARYLLKKAKRTEIKNQAGIHSLSSEPNGPICLIFSMITDIRDKLKLECVSKSFQELAQKFCWDSVHRLKITLYVNETMNPGNHEVDHFTFTINKFPINSRLSSLEKSFQGLQSLLQRCNPNKLRHFTLQCNTTPRVHTTPMKSEVGALLAGHMDSAAQMCPDPMTPSEVPDRFLTELFFKLREFQFSCEKFKLSGYDWVVGAKSTIPEFLLQHKEPIRSLAFSHCFLEFPGPLFNCFRQCPFLEHLSFDFKDKEEECNTVPAHLLYNTLKGLSLKSLNLDRAFIHLSTSEIAKCIGALQKLDVLNVDFSGEWHWPDFFNDPNCFRILRNLKACQWELFRTTYWYTNRNYEREVFCDFMPTIPNLCPALQKLTVPRVWNPELYRTKRTTEQRNEARFLEFCKRETIGVAKLMKTFLDKNANSDEERTLDIFWIRDDGAELEMFLEKVMKYADYDEIRSSNRRKRKITLKKGNASAEFVIN